MIQHVWSVLCQNVSLDSETNNISLFNVLQVLTTDGELSASRPALLSFTIMSLWHRDPNTSVNGEMRAYYVAPDGAKIDPITLAIDLSKTPYHTTRINAQNIPLFLMGTYYFHVEYRITKKKAEWQTATLLPLMVVTQPLLKKIK